MPIRYSSSGGTPFGDSNSRPSNPLVGQTYYNGQLGYLEIYTVSGWIPATGANDFSLNITGLHTSVTFSQTYSSGSYSIVSFLNDAAIDIYAYATDGSLAGYTNTKAFTATQRFNKMVVIGGSPGDVLQFSYKTTYATSPSTTDTAAGPYITSITPTGLPNKNDTMTITGGNFATDVAVNFTGTGYSSTAAKSIVRTSSTQLIVTRPDNFPPSGAPYTVTVTNPSVVNQPTGSSSHVYSGITSGVLPVWVTLQNQIITAGQPYSLALSATDADGGSTIRYSYVSGSIPTGITFNSVSGTLSGTTTATGSYTYTVRATDSGENYTDLTINFTSLYPTVTGGTLTSDSTYYYRTFTGNGNLVVSNTYIPCDILMVAGGGGAGKYSGGGAGSEVLTISRSLLANSYSITIGSGGAGQPGANYGWSDSRHGTATTGFGETCKPGGGGKNADDNATAGSTVSSGTPPDNGYDTRVANGGGGSSRSAGYYGTLGTSVGTGVTRYGGYRGGQTIYGSSSTNQGPNYPGAGGAGAGGGINGDTGAQTSRNSIGDGANGILSNLSGSNLYWAAGGGGTVYYANGTAGGGNGGLGGGGGGGGGSGSSGTATPGTGGGSSYNSGGNGQSGGKGAGGNGGQNTGSGGGAGRGETDADGGSGGSGIVIVRYTKASVGG